MKTVGETVLDAVKVLSLGGVLVLIALVLSQNVWVG